MKLVPIDWTQNVDPKNDLHLSLEGIDREMLKILNSKIPPDIKLKYYQQALSTYLQQHEHLNDPVEVRIKADKPTIADINTIAGSVSQRYQSTAKRLLSHLTQSSRLSWNGLNEVLIDQQRLPGTNIFHLVKDFASPATRGLERPVGYESFAKFLKDTNVPKEAVKNYQRWILIQPIPTVRAHEQVEELAELRRSRPRRRLMDQTPQTRSQTGGRSFWKKWQNYKI